MKKRSLLIALARHRREHPPDDPERRQRHMEEDARLREQGILMFRSNTGAVLFDMDLSRAHEGQKE